MRFVRRIEVLLGSRHCVVARGWIVSQKRDVSDLLSVHRKFRRPFFDEKFQTCLKDNRLVTTTLTLDHGLLLKSFEKSLFVEFDLLRIRLSRLFPFLPLPLVAVLTCSGH